MMRDKTYKAWYRIGGIVALAVVILRIIMSIKSTIPALYYFTVQTNLFVALYWLWVGWGRTDHHPRLRTWIAGAVTTYITITMVVYVALLHTLFMNMVREDLMSGTIGMGKYYLEVVMTYLMHAVIPLDMVVCYMFFTPMSAKAQPYQWLSYPLVYGIFHTLYGVWTGRFIYPFINPLKLGGWSIVLRNGLIVFVVFVLIGYGLYGFNRWINKRREKASHQKEAA